MSQVQVVGVMEGPPKTGMAVNKRLELVKQTQSLGVPNTGGEFIPATISCIKPYNYNTKIFSFNLEKSITLEMGQHVNLIGGTGMPMIRPYTPINPVGKRNSIDIMIKLYGDGRMGRFLSSAKVGTTAKFKTTRNKFNLTSSSTNIGMIAGGTGITPMIQVIQTILLNNTIPTLYLLYSNVMPEDILFKEQLDKWTKDFPEKLKVHYTLTNPPEEWEGLRGRVDKEKVEKLLPPPGETTKILVCGPIVMTNGINLMLHEMGYEDHMIFLFL